MKILGEIVEIDSQQILIPFFHRVAPSLISGSTVHGVCLLAEPAEIYLSPFPIRSWMDLWRLEVKFYDKPGLFKKLTGLLASEDVNVNILMHENSTNHQDGIFHITLICDLSGYGDSKNPDKTSGIRADDEHPEIQYLCDYITVDMFDDIVITNGKPSIKATRLEELHRIGQIHKSSYSPIAFKGIIKKGVLEIKEKGADFLAHAQLQDNGKYWVSVASDTEERFVKITALPNDRDSFILSVRHTDKAGQIARFTELLSEQFERMANIHCSYLRLKEADNISIWRCLLDVDKAMAQSYKDKITKIFSEANSKWKDPHLKVSFPLPIDILSENRINYGT